MNQPFLRWALMGTARINHALIPPLRACKRARLVAVASRDLHKAEQYANQWGIPRFFGSYEAALADPDIDVFYVSLPNSLHAEWSIKAVQAGKHVLCEKPLATSVEEVDAMIQAAHETGKIITEAFMYRHHPYTLKVKELVDSGAIGKLRLIRGSFSFNLQRQPDVRLDPGLKGGSIWDVGCYPINYARYITGSEPIEVFGWQVCSSTGVDETFVGNLRFPGNVMAQFDSSFTASFRMQVEIVGSEGTIVLPRAYKPNRYDRILVQRGNIHERFPVRTPELYLGEIEDLTDAILLGKVPRLSLQDSRANVAVITALLESSQTSAPVVMA